MGFAGDISTRVRMQIRSVSRSQRLGKKEGFGINYSLGTVTPGLPTKTTKTLFLQLFTELMFEN